MKRYGWVAAIAIVILANAVLLAGAWWNRTGEPDAEIEMTERELRIAGGREDDSGVALHLQWSPRMYDGTEIDWLDRRKLAEAGFDTSMDPSQPDADRFYERQLPRRAWIVLDYDGPAWETWLTAREEALRKQADGMLENDRPSEEVDEWLENQRSALRNGSRLVAVDAGADPVRLRERHPDRARAVIVQGIVRLDFLKRNPDDEPTIQGRVQQLLVERIHVPRAHAAPLATVLAADGLPRRARSALEREPRFAVRLRFGRRHEPWVEGVRLTDGSD